MGWLEDMLDPAAAVIRAEAARRSEEQFGIACDHLDSARAVLCYEEPDHTAAIAHALIGLLALELSNQ